jgi:hypothetical protein
MNATTERGGRDRASPVNVGQGTPKQGERFRCQQCGMEIQITADCKCQGPEHVHFQCCGQELRKV